jgi:alpha-N-arabinofuranosidase
MKLKITNNVKFPIQQGMIGLFFEDINYGLDGGLHAEMIENRSFEFVQTRGHNHQYEETFDGMYGWSTYPDSANGASLSIQAVNPLNATNPHYLAFTAVDTQLAFTNKAYDGICMKKGVSYHVSFYAKAEVYDDGIAVQIVKDGKVMASSVVASNVHSEWQQYHADLVCDEDVSYGAFTISLMQPGTVCFDFVSMIPTDAVLGLFRKDLVSILKDMKPGFLRFPGGCIVEGYSLDNRYQWKKSVGRAEERESNSSRWALHGNNEANHYTSPYSHYNQTLGIGFYEYFLLCEWLDAKPIPVVNVGLACQYQSTEIVHVDDPAFDAYIQDTLDLIEFANGPVDSPWGQLRMEMGHAEPFGLDMIGLGNEQWETEHVDFFRRYELFEQAIHARFPDIKIIGSAGPDVTSDKYRAAWDYYREHSSANSNFVYAVDEHYYVKPDWLYDNIKFYDNYPRDIKVFAGEYAAHYGNGMNSPWFNSWGAAMAEAAFLTGIERNADVVVLASYAPLLARLGYAQWSPNMIWFDGEHTYGTPSYYVQKLYSTLMGTDLLQVMSDGEEIPHTVCFDRRDQSIIVKLVNASDHPVCVQLETEFSLAENGEVYMMQGNEDDVNSIEDPQRIAPLRSTINIAETMDYEIGARSFHVIKMYVRNTTDAIN